MDETRRKYAPETRQHSSQQYGKAAAGHSKNKKKKKRRLKKKYRIILTVLIITLVLAGIGLGLFLYIKNLRTNTKNLFDTVSVPVVAATAAPVVSVSPEPTNILSEATPAPTASPEPDDYSKLKTEADSSLMQNIVNVLLVGIDYSEERTQEDWLQSGGSTSEHADVMIVLAVNFDKNTVDMISLPRDTYTKIPNVQGIYKLNASLDCGGGLFKKDETGQWITDSSGNKEFNPAGLEKVCESCSWIIGGIPINYYYAVTMPAVKELVNTIGGVDFNLDLSFSMQGRSYTAGQQHMDGQAVLDYLRVRKAASMEGATTEDVGDDARVNRQKDMLVAILNQLKSTNTLLKIPEILSNFSGQLFTNCSFEQTAALALYAYDMPSSNIRMHSMVGEWGESKRCANQHFYFLDPDKRVELIKEVYNVDVPKELEITKDYGYFNWSDQKAARYLDTTYPLKQHLGETYSNVKKLKATAEKAAQEYLENDGKAYLSGTVNELERGLERLMYAGQQVKDAIGYKKRLDFYSVLEHYNDIQVDPS